jgi:sugar lactone lactonase YvrE
MTVVTNLRSSFSNRRAAIASALLLAASFAPTALHAQTVTFAGAQSVVGNGFAVASGIVTDGKGDIFVADYTANAVYEIVAVHGVPASNPTILTLAGGFSRPYDLAVDGNGDLFVADAQNDAIKEIVAVNGSIPTSNPTVLTLGGGFAYPNGVAVDRMGDVFVADTYNNAVKEIVAVNGSIPSSNPTILTLGSGFTNPSGIALDSKGDLFVVGDGQVNEMVAVNGSIPASDPTILTLASGFPSPVTVAVDGGGNVFFVDSIDRTVKEIAAVNGSIPASNPTILTLGGGFTSPWGVAVDGQGKIVVSDQTNVDSIQTSSANMSEINVCPSGQSSPAPCSQTLTFTYDVASGVTLGAPHVVTQGAPNSDFSVASNACTGHVTAGNSCTMRVTFTPQLAGPRNGALQILDDSGNILTTTYTYGIGVGPQIAFGPGTQTILPASGLDGPTSTAVDGSGDVFIADSMNHRVVEVTGGTQTTVPATGLSEPYGVAVDGAGDVFIVDASTNQVVEVTPSRVQSTVPASGLNSPDGVAVDGSGDVFIADTGNSRVVEVTPAGEQTTVPAHGLTHPVGVAVDGAGDVFISDASSNRVVEVTPAGVQTTLPAHGLNEPYGVAVDGAGDVFIADFRNQRVVEVTPAGVQTTVPTSGLSYFEGVALDAAGDLFIADTDHNQVVELGRGQPPSLSFATTAPGDTSGDSPQSVTIENIGNAPLTAASLSVAANFAQVPGTGTPADCTASFSLAPGASCDLSISFTPQTTGSFQGSVVLTDNALNENPAKQSIALAGSSRQISQTITFTGLPTTVTYGAGPYTLKATASSELPVTYKVVGPGSLNGNILTITGAGQVQVGALQNGDAQYAPATQVTQSIAVKQAPLVVTANNLTKAYEAVNPTLTYSASGFVNGDTKAVLTGAPVLSTTAGQNSPIGKYPITITQGTLATPSYKLQFVAGTLTVATAEAITFKALPNVTYGVAPSTLTATASSGLPVSYSVTGPVTLSGNKLTVTGAGIVTVEAMQAGGSGHAAAVPVSRSFTVNPAPLTVKADNLSIDYGTPLPAFTGKVTGAVNGDKFVESFTTTATASSHEGTYSIVPAVTGAGNYDVTIEDGTLTIKQAGAVVTLTSSDPTAQIGQKVTFTAIVRSSVTGAATGPTGTVAFYQGTTELGTATLSKGICTLTTSFSAKGTAQIKADYLGDVNFTASNSPVFKEVISQ